MGISLRFRILLQEISFIIKIYNGSFYVTFEYSHNKEILKLFKLQKILKHYNSFTYLRRPSSPRRRDTRDHSRLHIEDCRSHVDPRKINICYISNLYIDYIWVDYEKC